VVSNTTSAAFYLNGGVTVINSTLQLGNPTTQGTTAGAMGTVNLNGGTLMDAMASISLTNGVAAGSPVRPVFLGGNGGGLAAQSGYTFTIPGVVSGGAGTGPLTIGIAASSANGDVVALVPGTGTSSGVENGTNVNPAFSATGTVVLGAVNTYFGGTTVASGALELGAANAVPGVGPSTVTVNSGATWSLNGWSDTIDGLAGGGTVDGSGGAPTLTIGNAGSGGVFSGVLQNSSGSLALTKTGTGAEILSGVNTYTGPTTVLGGALDVNSPGSLAAGSAVTVDNGGILGGSGTISGNVTVEGGGATLPGPAGVTTTFAGSLAYVSGSSADFALNTSAAGPGNDQIVLNGAGAALTCGGVSVYVSAYNGTLDPTRNYVLFNVTGAGGSISGGFNSTPQWVGTPPAGSQYYQIVTTATQVLLEYLPVAPVISAASAAPNPTIANQTVTYSATVAPGSGAVAAVTVNLVSVGGLASQALTWDGQSDNVWSASVLLPSTVSPDTYTLGVTATGSDGNLNGAAVSTGSVSLTVSLPPATPGSPLSQTWDGAAADNLWSDPGNWTNSLAPQLGDTLYFDGPTGLSPVMNQSYGVVSVAFESTAGGFDISASGGGVLTLTGGVVNNSPNAQTLNVPVALNAAAVTVEDAAGGGLALSGVISGPAGDGLLANGAGTVTLSGVDTYLGATSIGAGALVIGGAGQLGGGNYAANIANSGVLIFDSTASQTLSGVVSGAGMLLQNGSGALTLSGTNTYTGGTTINAGALVIGGAGQLGGGAYAGNITNNGVLSYSSSAAQTNLGVISGTGALNQNGSGALTLSASNTYTGGTTVNAGTLALIGAGSIAGSTNLVLASGATLDVSAAAGFTVGAAQTLSGTGAVNGAVTLDGALSPGGGAVGALTFSNGLTLAAGSTNIFKIVSSPLTNDAVVVLGALTNGGTLLVTNIGLVPLAGNQSFQLLTAAGYNGVFAQVQLPSLPLGLGWNTNQINTTGLLTILVTNQPSFQPLAISASGLVFAGGDGVADAPYYLLTSTNPATPLSNWTPVVTNFFDAGGNFNFTNPPDPTQPQQFFILELPCPDH
jgi:autotransporter-associated beta strand protein